MKLTHLSLTNYRSYARLDIGFPDGILVLAGGNAQGKTTILEALFFCAAFSSPLAKTDRELISLSVLKDPLAVARIVAGFEQDGKSHKIETRVILDNSIDRVRKEILVDGIKSTSQKTIGNFTAVLFLPQMTRILEGAPEERRRYLNIMLSQSVPGYASALTAYKRIVIQRNALLRNLNERHADPEQLRYWDQMLAQRAAIIMKSRAAAVLALEDIGEQIHSELTSGTEAFRIAYRPSFDLQGGAADKSLDEIAAAYLDKLHQNYQTDIQRIVTTVGPHKDDFFVFGNGLNLSTYGSRGQIRTALLTLKLTEIEWMKQKTGSTPLLLLDETMAELDEKRRYDLVDRIEQCPQAILTTSDLTHFSRDFIEKQTIWDVSQGMISVHGTSAQ